LDLFFTEQATKESLPASVRSSLYLRSRAASIKSQATKVEEMPSEDEANNKDSEIARLGNYSDKFDYDLYERLYDLLHLDDDIGIKGRFMHNWIKGDLIGKGSFANVYYGYDPETEIIMAVKQVDLPASSSFLNDRRSKMLTSLTREIEFLKTLRHENVVGYLGSCCDGLTLNVFLEYVGGGSIASLIQKQGWISLDDTKVYVKQILTGLSYLHGLKIIHRDIKGGNVLVTEDKKCKISDFGVATLMDSVISKRHSVQGSVFWMSPEMVKRTSCTTKVDIWSLGCLVLEMLTGERPWYGFDQIQALYQIGMGLKNPIDHLNEVWQENSGTSFTSSLPQTALEFLQAMFKADPEERASADLLLDSEFLKIV
jgi:mitogen-activated protein kinase kinase kinase